MVHEFYGDAAFRDATQSFLRAFAFGAVDTQGFLAEFGAALDRSEQGERTGPRDGTSAAELLGRWIDTPGFPLIRVRRGERSLRIRQERFDYLAGWVLGPIGLERSDYGNRRERLGRRLRSHAHRGGDRGRSSPDLIPGSS